MDHEGQRRPLLAKVHIARKDLGLSEEEYRATLRELFGVESSARLSVPRLSELLVHFTRRGWRGPLDLSDRPGFLEIPDSDPHARQKRYILALARRLGWAPGVLQRYMRAKVRTSSLANLHDPARLRILARDLWGRCLRQGIDPEPRGGQRAEEIMDGLARDAAEARPARGKAGPAGARKGGGAKREKKGGR